ncbi:hybrid sensor histidine kinase/response regulator [Pseudomonas daroniae]|uniref:histidine kinase n=1 Tax=Phytopseudomonas daroniae TaxID=2487519 RepID=A0A4Q9QL78_9GAMM|nr:MULTISPECIES: hybrid sensor histidine kinase/response regulator [Pseudomonas]TBU77690.1 hybrid sensor histidine kinase/response regulator [Pseudomonas daroniae]TBU78365.1 hybrid sensor histidine kinase/response regulator [Pseudomonas daroniae]TBU85842.1 hybrid sensor histidine kinase/response regulator [Pseudomonas sp. FRB 228]TBU95004.1 hybrid sensor histidine kinase/response regulator [Pseudomonas daroniae]
MRFFLIILLAICPVLASAAGPAVFDENTRSLPLGQLMSVFEDVRGDKTIDDVTSRALQGSFRAHDKPVLNAGYSRSAFWLRVDLQYLPQDSIAHGLHHHWLLELAYPPLDHLELYEADSDGHFRLTQRTGDALPFSSREIRQNNYLFSLDFEPDQVRRVYLRIESQGSIQAPLTLWSPTAYLEKQPARIYVLGIIYGVLLVMLIYNLFIFISVRDTSYLYYILYIASFGLYQVSVNGAGIEFFWPDNPWWANVATPFLIGATALFGCQFARSFLQTSEHSPWVDRCLLLLMLWGTAVMVLALTVSYAVSLRLATVLALVFTLVVSIAGVLAWLRGMRVARYFIIAWAAFLIGGVVNTLMVLGYLPNVFLTMYASQIGSAIEVALLSLALADRINGMKEERARILQSAAAKLEALNHELADSNRLKDDFLATVTHELRTPMNGVIGSLELMQTLRLEPEVEQYQKTATRSARDMMQMVNDILALTELQSGRLYPRRETFSLRGLLDGVCANYEGRARDKGLAFTLDLDERLPDTVEGDAVKLAQGLGYLLDNAIKFTAAGKVCLRVRGGEPTLEALPLSFEVIDAGIGLADAREADLYLRFHQLDNSMTRQYGGLGIGLSICRQLVDLLGGSLAYEPNRAGAGGSIFRLSLTLALPVQKGASEPVVRRANGSPVRVPEQCTVLVVEDNAINQLVIRGMLLKLGYRVRTADNGSEALECLQRESVDALLLDCQMPVMDGFATCRALRLLPGCAELPVLAITAHSQSGDRERCLAAGMSDYLAKPVKFDELRVLLHDWVLCRTA